MKRGCPLVLAVLLAVLGLPAAAAATAQIYCVNESACPAGGKNEGSNAEAVQKALEGAEANSGSTVLVGPGHYQRVIKEGFSYNSSHPVTIHGAGEGVTVLSTVLKPSGPVLNLFNSPATVSGMTIEIAAETDLLGINANAATIEHVAVVATGGENDEGVKMDGGVFREGSIDLSRNTGEFPVGVLIGGGEVIGSTIVAVHGISSSSPGTDVVRSSRIAAVDGLLLEGNATIEDTLVDARHAEHSRAVTVEASKKNATATLRQLTIVNGGKESTGVELVGNEAKEAATISNSVIAGFGTPIETEAGGAGSGLTATTSYSSYEAANDVNVGGAPKPTDENPVAGTPGFAKPLFTEGGFAEANWSPSYNSSLMDAGAPGALAAGEATADLAGSPRLVNGRRDVGAYEFQRAAPLVSASGPSTAALGEAVSFSGSATTPEVAAGDAIAGYQWTFDDGTVAPAGASATHAFSTLGVHTGTLTAGDLLGVLGSVTVTVTVTLAPFGPRCTCRPAPNSLTLLRLSPASFHAARSGASVTHRHVGSRVTFNLSRATTPAFTVERGATGIIEGHACVARRRGHHGKSCTRYTHVRGSFARNGESGANSFRFSGRVGGHTLAPGRYVLVATVPGAGRSPVRTAFRILA